MSACIVLSKAGLPLDVVEHYSGRISIETGLFMLSMTVEEARVLATKLQNAAVQATALVPIEEAA